MGIIIRSIENALEMLLLVWSTCYGLMECGSVQSGRNVIANHRDLVPCILTEMWQPIAGIRYHAFWQKCDCQSQGFGSV